MDKTIPESWGLGMAELEQIYRVEVEQADKLRQAPAAQRKQLYSPVYEEYFRKLPFHPQLTIKQNEAAKQSRVDYQLRQILPLIRHCDTFMEVGAGDASLSIAASKHCNNVIALEVSEQVAANAHFPSNLRLILFDGFNIPLPDNSVSAAYSNQLMEHLHPDDATEQLRSIYRVLKPGGVYICITPNRISGPHDISRFFTDRPVGFHLKEYSATELSALFRSVGFSRVITYTILKGRRVVFPLALVTLTEKIADSLSGSLKKRFMELYPVKIVLTAVVAGVK